MHDDDWTEKWGFTVCPIGLVHFEYFIEPNAFGIFRLVSCFSFRFPNWSYSRRLAHVSDLIYIQAISVHHHFCLQRPTTGAKHSNQFKSYEKKDMARFLLLRTGNNELYLLSKCCCSERSKQKWAWGGIITEQSDTQEIHINQTQSSQTDKRKLVPTDNTNSIISKSTLGVFLFFFFIYWRI